MKRLVLGYLMVLALFGAFMAGCSDEDGGPAGKNADIDTDSDTDVDTHRDTDTDTDTDTNTDTEHQSGSGAMDTISQLRAGWNLGNSLDATPDETSWGNPATSQTLISAVADAGFDTIRIPITWQPHMADTAPYTIDATYLARVATVVDYALNADMHVIINVHHDGAYDTNGWEVPWISLEAPYADVEARFVAVWRQIADHFANVDARLMFESMNEVHVGYPAADQVPVAHYDFVNDLNQAFVNTVRTSPGYNMERILVVPGYNTNIDATVYGFELPIDTIKDRLAITVHFYDPYTFALAAETQTWGTGNAASGDEWAQEARVEAQFDLLKTDYIDNGIPVIIGEWGATHQAGYEDFRRYYTEYVAKAAYDRTILSIIWDNGGTNSGAENSGLFYRSTGEQAFPAIIDAIARATGDDYRIEDIVLP